MARANQDLRKKALAIAKTAHAGQVDKGGHPYMQHIRAVKRMVKTPEAKIVALLHDVCEDSDTTLDDLRDAGFPETIIMSVDAVTKRPDETYREYIARIKTDRTAIEVKIADARHNSDLSRIPYPTGVDLIRSERYMRTVRELQQFISEK